MVSGTISLLLSRCFSPFLHSTRTLSVSLEYLALPDGPGGFAQNSSCSALLRIPLGRSRIRVRGYHPLWPHFPARSTHFFFSMLQSYNPAAAGTAAVWALPRSLATTRGIIFIFSSCGYYDVSVPRVRLRYASDDRPSACRVVPFGNLRIKGHLHLPEAYRSLSRPSSPVRA